MTGLFTHVAPRIPAARCRTHLALRCCRLLVETEAKQPWGGARHLGLELPTQLPLVDTAALASGQNLWRAGRGVEGQDWRGEPGKGGTSKTEGLTRSW